MGKTGQEIDKILRILRKHEKAIRALTSYVDESSKRSLHSWVRNAGIRTREEIKKILEEP